MSRLFDDQGEEVFLEREIGRGGEGKVYLIRNRRGLCGKVFVRRPETELVRKLSVMVKYKPEDSRKSAPGRPSLAWPLSLLRNESKDVVGYLMPFLEVEFYKKAVEIFTPGARQRLLGGEFTWLHLLKAALNLASTVAAIHSKHHVVGDLRDANVLVGGDCSVAFVDCDSFQIFDESTHTYFPCTVGTPEYLAPELHQKDLKKEQRSKESDCFSLAILVFQFLMEGYHPFQGRGVSAATSLHQNIALGNFAFNEDNKGLLRPSGAPSLSILPVYLQRRFKEAFVYGHKNPSIRPTAPQWYEDLRRACEEVTVCAENENHRYWEKLKLCPWCDLRRSNPEGRDPFPPPAGAQALMPDAFARFGTEQAREKVFRDHVAVALVDGVLTKEEEEYLVGYGERLGFRRIFVEKVIQEEIKRSKATRAEKVLGVPLVELDRKELCFYRVKKGEELKGSVVVANVGGGSLEGTVKADEPWLIPEQRRLNPAVHRQEIRFTVETREFRVGEEREGRLLLKTNAGEFAFTVKVQMEVPSEALKRVRYLVSMSLGCALGGTGLLIPKFYPSLLFFVILFLALRWSWRHRDDGEKVALGWLGLLLALVPALGADAKQVWLKLVANVYSACFLGATTGFALAPRLVAWEEKKLLQVIKYICGFGLAAWALGLVVVARQGQWWLGQGDEPLPVSGDGRPERRVIPPIVTVKERVANIRERPELGARVMGKARAGESFYVDGEYGNWWKIRFASGDVLLGEAWISKTVVEAAATAKNEGVAWVDRFYPGFIGSARKGLGVTTFEPFGGALALGSYSSIEYFDLVPWVGTIEVVLRVDARNRYEGARTSFEEVGDGVLYFWGEDSKGQVVGGFFVDLGGGGWIRLRDLAGAPKNGAAPSLSEEGFHYGAWHVLAISYGPNNCLLRLDAEDLAKGECPSSYLALLGRRGLRQYVVVGSAHGLGLASSSGGFDGAAYAFRASPRREDWLFSTARFVAALPKGDLAQGVGEPVPELSSREAGNEVTPSTQPSPALPSEAEGQPAEGTGNREILDSNTGHFIGGKRWQGTITWSDHTVGEIELLFANNTTRGILALSLGDKRCIGELVIAKDKSNDYQFYTASSSWPICDGLDVVSLSSLNQGELLTKVRLKSGLFGEGRLTALEAGARGNEDTTLESQNGPERPASSSSRRIMPKPRRW